MTEKYPNAPDCPFCGSSDLSDADWWDDDGEFDAIECNDCKGSEPAEVWCGNTRPKSEAEELLEWLNVNGGLLMCNELGCLVQAEGVRKERNTPLDALRAAREAMKDD